MKDKVRILSEKSFLYVCGVYKHLHANPELSFQEQETAAYIQKKLESLNIPYRSNIGGFGILAVLEGNNPNGKTVALRADMDALPIQEDTTLDYKSTKDHCMHACGHDSHVASLLGVAKVLSEIKDEMEGTVLFIFQPGEERHPGGARLMLQDNVFSDYKPDVILAQHASVDYPMGSVAFRSGQIMASADEVHLTIKGKGGHAALPHLYNDTVLCASQILVSLQQISARIKDPLIPMVLSFGKLIADGSTNVIPEEVKLSGTFRTFDENWRSVCKGHIRRIATETALAYGCVCDVDLPDGYPSVNNDFEVTKVSKQYATEVVGENNIKELEVRMTGEDFSFFSQEYPSTFFRFGIKGNTNKNTGNLHTPNFEIDLDVFKTSVSVMSWMAWQHVNCK